MRDTPLYGVIDTVGGAPACAAIVHVYVPVVEPYWFETVTLNVWEPRARPP